MTTGIWAAAAVLMVAVVSYYTAQANIEDSKQIAFMMEACVKNGGEWKRSEQWGPIRFDCLRPADHHQ